MKKDLINRFIRESNKININSRKCNGAANYIIVNSILSEEINKISIKYNRKKKIEILNNIKNGNV